MAELTTRAHAGTNLNNLLKWKWIGRDHESKNTIKMLYNKHWMSFFVSRCVVVSVRSFFLYCDVRPSEMNYQKRKI